MRKRLKSLGILITLFFLASFILLFVSLTITQPKKRSCQTTYQKSQPRS